MNGEMTVLSCQFSQMPSQGIRVSLEEEAALQEQHEGRDDGNLKKVKKVKKNVGTSPVFVDIGFSGSHVNSQ